MEAAERKVNVPDQSEWKFYDGKVILTLASIIIL